MPACAFSVPAATLVLYFVFCHWKCLSPHITGSHSLPVPPTHIILRLPLPKSLPPPSSVATCIKSSRMVSFITVTVPVDGNSPFYLQPPVNEFAFNILRRFFFLTFFHPRILVLMCLAVTFSLCQLVGRNQSPPEDVRGSSCHLGNLSHRHLTLATSACFFFGWERQT